MNEAFFLSVMRKRDKRRYVLMVTLFNRKRREYDYEVYYVRNIVLVFLKEDTWIFISISSGGTDFSQYRIDLQG